MMWLINVWRSGLFRRSNHQLCQTMEAANPSESVGPQQSSERSPEEIGVSRDHLKDVKTDEPSVGEYQQSRDVGKDDESQDTTSKTSARLVKFQLFETKAVWIH